MSMKPFDRSWQRAWHNLGAAAPDGLQARLLDAYAGPQRHYHARQHLEECLAQFDAAIDLAVAPGEVELALWFHDAVYDPRGSGNERLSADWAARELALCGMGEQVIRRVDELIMATCHTASPNGQDQQLLVVIDLAILGASPERFAEYDRQVKAEYAWVPEALYEAKRKEVLSGFLAHGSIYNTARFRDRYEAQARANLRGAIERIAGDPP